MFILHLFSNWKWTGPAEHALNLCCMLKLRGHRVVFACGTPPEGDVDNIRKRAAGLGVETLDLRLRKHLNFVDNWRDVWAISRYIMGERPDIIHVHMTNDNLLAGLSALVTRSSVPIVRTSYEGNGLKRTIRNRTLVSRLTSGLVVVSKRAGEADVENFHLPRNRVWKVDVGVDTNRFSPRKSEPQLRKTLGIGPEEVVVGVVARIQWHRRFDVFLEAFHRASGKMPNLRAMLVGRGTNMVPVAVEPAKRMGLNGKVVFPGYKYDDEYVDALASMDIKVFLVPGTDGSCRAVREAMAMGLPVIAARRGMLPEIVQHGENGFIVDDTPENLSEAIVKLASDEALRRRMGAASRQIAVERFSLDKEVKEIEAVYKSLLVKS
ncbi:MAG TPA: glycosyltransferase family 4 protein [Candidatus Avalokitesvara rifleensis]|uniref:glycosyltransferase family 4 protein n=1 Tax=Candidatus Avalokitesvara rifleensis TaxID=3367620 RepID=UPI0027141659|nr:glycosyltransferase family 4 protein [Candidatus Brocadiales bacterium]